MPDDPDQEPMHPHAEHGDGDDELSAEGIPSTPRDGDPGHRSGYVALAGPPNVGKSTLMNALVGQKLSIVTPRPSTTRHRVLGILSSDDYQIVFVDTPGLIRPMYRLHEVMVRTAEHAVADADVVLFIVDASEARLAEEELARVGDRLAPHAPIFLVLNKIDLLPQEAALPLVERYAGVRSFDEIIPVSALKVFNVGRLLELVVQRLPGGPPYYPKDQLSEHPERFFVAELIREKIFEQFRAEIPYSTQVNIVMYEEREGAKDFIDAEIVVERESQKGIIIGKGGAGLKRLGQASRRSIEEFLGKSVYLQLHVKARADWRNREAFLRSFGYR